MPPTQYDFDVDLDARCRIVVRFMLDKTTVTNYAVILVGRIDGRDQTIRLYDNAHEKNHMHRYTRTGGKQLGEVLSGLEYGRAMRDAIEQIRATYEEMVRSWDR